MTLQQDKHSYNVLFLCTGNSSRSILAEAILNRAGEGRFKAFSAGSRPQPSPNPLALALLKEMNYEIDGLRSKGWDEFAAPDSLVMDFVFTVCDGARGENCPFWPGAPVSAHWGMADPAAVKGTDEQKRKAFRRAYIALEERIRIFTSLRLDQLDALTLQRRLEEIGQALKKESPGH